MRVYHTTSIQWTIIVVSVRPRHLDFDLMDGWLSRAAILPLRVGVTMEVQDQDIGSIEGKRLPPKPRAARGKWTAQQRRQIIEASMVEGAVIGEVATQYGVWSALIASWRRQLERQPTRGAGAKKSPHFAAVRVDRVSAESMIEIDLANRCIRVRGIVDALMLREVLAALR